MTRKLLAQTTSGVKAALATLAQPLAARDRSTRNAIAGPFPVRAAARRIPIKISGTRDKPSFGVDVGKALTGR